MANDMVEENNHINDMMMLQRSRRLQTDPGLVVGVTIGAFMVVAALLSWFFVVKKKRSKAAKLRYPPEDDDDDDYDDEIEKEDPEVAKTESNESADEPEPHAAHMTTCDVHNCSSGSCAICRKDLGPQFVTVKGGTKLQKNLPDRWWDKDFDENEMKCLATQPADADRDKSGLMKV